MRIQFKVRWRAALLPLLVCAAAMSAVVGCQEQQRTLEEIELEQRELPYVTELRALRTVPSMASMLLPRDLLDDCGWDRSKVLHS